MTPKTNRTLTWVTGVTAAAATFAAVSAGYVQFAINMTCLGLGLAAGLSLGFAIRRRRGDR